ncbi:MAG TPA: hypothetical protein VIV58_35605 [Kofleriaceae bacterium]
MHSRADAAEKLPAECRPYARIPADARDDILGWNQLLSLAACLQDASITPVADREGLVNAMETYVHALEIPTTLYIGALRAGPGPVQVRAAYQIAMLHVTLIIRARSSLVTPVDFATNPEAARLDAELHADLEELLAPSLRVATVSFGVIVRAVEEDPTLAPDPVTRNMVHSARAMLEILTGENPRDDRSPARVRSSAR